ncbi:MAG TPA: DNA-binding protein WhiA, partial [Methanoculleus sp.]|nr:DNA-binding protein WhiA [Methanoculleus sp.]
DDPRFGLGVRATATRVGNFDDANLRRSARAAVAAGARVERALEILGDTVPDHLAAAGRLRLEHKQASLEELGGLADPPMRRKRATGTDTKRTATGSSIITRSGCRMNR